MRLWRCCDCIHDISYYDNEVQPENTITTMKLNDKRFRQGLKTNYYPSFFHAMMDSFRFSVLWTAVITVLLCIIPLIIYLRNVESLSLSIISVGLSFLFVVFIISNAIFLYENWYKQNRTLNKMKRLLPEGCDILSIEYNDPALPPVRILHTLHALYHHLREAVEGLLSGTVEPVSSRCHSSRRL